MREVWILCVLLAGCDEVWSIDHVGDSAGDAPNAITCEQDHHDEDGDGFPDACDRCPGIADDQADADGDSVGDACDPSGTTRERVDLFLSFGDGAQLWTPLNGTWPVEHDDLIYASTALTSNAYVLYTGVVPEPPFVLEYSYTVDSIDTVGSLFMVVLDSDSSGKGVNCGHQRQVGPLKDTVRATYTGVTADQTEIMTVTPGRYRVVAAYDRERELRCSIASDDGSTSGATKIALSPTPPAGTFGFRSLQIGANVHYVAIYKTY